ncbi:gamma carbonic anhydrase family protein [Pararhizobium sp. IMCC21322]|uniref:gamma carbonic anhydrase family protein n=1 Tax=Pararhizobium sp. IMCC21322 TaxID=3067903 RepID=UPI0027411300|nr:gamma carbonic anhydrase family protein [Pararhizobium sp. IMCC21322]
MPVYELDGQSPEHPGSDDIWIAPDSHIIGNVKLGPKVGIWFGAVLRGDNELIIIGEGTNIQEHTMVHTDPGFPATIGKNCTIGHRAIIHGCTIDDNSLIGMGAIVLNGAHIGKNCLIGAGALIPEGKNIPDNSLVVGMPGKVIRTLTDDDASKLTASALNYQKNAKRFLSGLKQV